MTGTRALIVLVAALCMVPSPARAADAPAPTVAFLDEREFDVSYGELEEADGLAVTVRNDDAVDQDVTVKVMGLVPRDGEPHTDLRALLRRATTERISGRGARRLVVPLATRSEAVAPPDGTYTGVVVASGKRGPLVRRPFTLTVAEAPVTARGAALAVGDLADQSLSAINYLPSLLAPLGPSVLALGLGLLGLGAVLWMRPRSRWAGPAVAAALVAIVAGGLGAGPLHPVWKRDRQDGWQAIATKPVALGGVEAGTYGAATDEDGGVAALVVRDGHLDVDGLERAGSYGGTLDLTPGEEAGDAEVTVSVRDWWLFAFAVIALGVLAGYLVRRWFQVILPRNAVVEDADALRQAAWATTRPSPFYTAFEGQVEKIRQQARRDPAGARTALEALTGKLSEYQDFLHDVAGLSARLRRLRAAAPAAGIRPETVDSLQAASTALGGALSVQGDRLAQRRADVRDAHKALVALDDALADAFAGRVEAERLGAAAHADPDLKKAYDALVTRFRDLERKVFVKPAAAVRDEINAAQEELYAVAPAPGGAVAGAAAFARAPEGQEAAEPFAALRHGTHDLDAVASVKQAEDADVGVRTSERRASLTAGALAVAAGLSTLYFTDGVWGTPGDYLAAFVWGAAVAEGLKYVQAIATKIWSS